MFLGWSAAGGVGVAELGGPDVVAVEGCLVGESVSVSDGVVVFADGCGVGNGGWSAFCIGGGVVVVALCGGDTTSGDDAGVVTAFGDAALLVVGSAAGDTAIDR